MGARRLLRSAGQRLMACSLGADVFRLRRGSVFLGSAQPSLEAVEEILTPGEHLQLFHQCRGRNWFYGARVSRCCPCPSVDFGSFLQPCGSERKIVSLTPVGESSWETSKEAAKRSESFPRAS